MKLICHSIGSKSIDREINLFIIREDAVRPDFLQEIAKTGDPRALFQVRQTVAEFGVAQFNRFPAHFAHQNLLRLKNNLLNVGRSLYNGECKKAFKRT